jgi:hypothetical protein
VRRALSIAVIAASACANPAHYRFESRPTARTVDPASCYEGQRIELATGSFSWAQVVDTGTRITPGYGGGFTVSTGGPKQYQALSGRGLVLHSGGQRLNAVAALEKIGDREILEHHELQLDLTSGPASRYPFYRKSSIGLIAIGTPITLVASGMVLFMDDPAPGAYTAIGGLSLLAVGVGLYLGAVLSGPDYARHARDTKLLVDPEVSRRAAEAALAHNRRLAERCSVRGDLPMTDSARRLLRR